MKRVQLCEQLDEPDQAKEETFIEAVRTIDPRQALGDYVQLWIDYANFYAEYGQPDRAKEIFERGLIRYEASESIP